MTAKTSTQRGQKYAEENPQDAAIRKEQERERYRIALTYAKLYIKHDRPIPDFAKASESVMKKAMEQAEKELVSA